MIELVVLGATLAFAAGASGAQLHRKHHATRVLARYATSRRCVFVPAPPSPRGASPRVEGERDGVRFVLDLYKIREVLRTRVSALVVTGRLPRFDVVRGVVHAETPDDADSVRHLAAEALVTFRARRDVVLSSDGTRVVFSWPGIESNPLLLDAARDAVTALARLHAPGERPYR